MERERDGGSVEPGEEKEIEIRKKEREREEE